MAHFNTPNEIIKIAFTQIESGRALYRNVVGTLTAMRTGDGNVDASYAGIKTKLGLASDAEAHSAYNELASGLGNLENAQAALDQVFNQFRQL